VNDFVGIAAGLEKRLAEWGNDDEEEEADDGVTSKKGLPEKKKKKLLDPKTWERDGRLVTTALALRKQIGGNLFEDHDLFRDRVDDALKQLDIKLSAADLKLILRAVEKEAEGLLDELLMGGGT